MHVAFATSKVDEAEALETRRMLESMGDEHEQELEEPKGRGLALCVDEGGGSETVEIDLVAPVVVGDRLLVHAGTAIAKLSEEALG